MNGYPKPVCIRTRVGVMVAAFAAWCRLAGIVR
jgi:hypothetical protein